jgi:hypothetical protein
MNVIARSLKGYGLFRKGRAKKLAAKRRSVNSTTAVLLPILVVAFESEVKILRGSLVLGKSEAQYACLTGRAHGLFRPSGIEIRESRIGSGMAMPLPM